MMNWEGRRIPKKCLAHLEGKFCTYHGLTLVQYQDQLFFGPILLERKRSDVGYDLVLNDNLITKYIKLEIQ